MSKLMLVRTDLDGARKALRENKRVFVRCMVSWCTLNHIVIGIGAYGSVCTDEGSIFDTGNEEFFVEELV